MALFDLLGRRWTLRILWELRNGPLTFRQLRAAADQASPSVLNQRLSELKHAQLVQLENIGYALTPLGQELIGALQPTLAWSKRWAQHYPDAADEPSP